jgi:hypothetical protein
MKLKNRLLCWSSAVVFAGFAQFALGQQCGALIQLQLGLGASAASLYQSFPECFAGNSAPLAQQSLLATSIRHAIVISDAIGSQARLAAPPRGAAGVFGLSGRAAGDAASPWSLWGNAGRNTFNYSGPAATSNTEGGVSNYVIGADRRLSSSLSIGVSAAVDEGGSKINKVAYGTKGYSLAPYLAWQLSPEWSLDASLGVGSGKFDNSTGVRADTDRSFAAVNANYVLWSGSWQIAGKAGLLHATEKYGDLQVANTAGVPNSATRNTLDQFRGSVQVGYWMQDGIMPYAGIGYTTDLSRPDQQNVASLYGRSAIPLSAGINFFSLRNSVTGGLAYVSEVGRSAASSRTLSANLSIRF